MKKTLWIIIALVVIGGIILLGNKPKSQEIKLGVIAGTTGEYASAGEGYMKGFNLAVEEWNNSHNLKFSPIIEDDSFNAVKGLSAYKKLSGLDKVDAYAILSSFTIDAVYDSVHTENKPVALGFEQSKPAEDDNIFQVLPAARPVQLALGKELKRLGYVKPAVVLSNNTPVYQNFYSGFIEGFGQQSVTKYDIGSDIGTLRSQALAIMNSKPDVVVFFGVPKDCALIVKEILKIAGGSPPKFAFDNSFESGLSDYQNILGSDINKINGSIISMSKNDYTEEFKNSFKAKYNEDAPFGSDMGFNSFMLLANTYDSSPDTWIGNMKKAKFIGADGELMFDNSGLRVPNAFFGKVENGVVIK
ncbi:MAG: ABC transporter substrate-binding protein [Patescibacteria group bacterium]